MNYFTKENSGYDEKEIAELNNRLDARLTGEEEADQVDEIAADIQRDFDQETTSCDEMFVMEEKHIAKLSGFGPGRNWAAGKKIEKMDVSDYVAHLCSANGGDQADWQEEVENELSGGNSTYFYSVKIDSGVYVTWDKNSSRPLVILD